MERCPTCGARHAGGPSCHRCRTDLGQVLAIERAWRWPPWRTATSRRRFGCGGRFVPVPVQSRVQSVQTGIRRSVGGRGKNVEYEQSGHTPRFPSSAEWTVRRLTSIPCSPDQVLAHHLGIAAVLEEALLQPRLLPGVGGSTLVVRIDCGESWRAAPKRRLLAAPCWPRGRLVGEIAPLTRELAPSNGGNWGHGVERTRAMLFGRSGPLHCTVTA